MEEQDLLAEQFELHRSHLRTVAYQMLGSRTEAEDAVQDVWLRLSRVDAAMIDNLRGWLTTVVGRVCLDMLRSRRSRREAAADGQLPERAGGETGWLHPEYEALVADSVGLALLVVLETLTPAERLAFVLHDLFAVPFDEIAPIVGRTPAAARKLASRERHRVQRSTSRPEADIRRQREVVEAFLAASRGGSFAALLAVLDPDVVLRADAGVGTASGPLEVYGASAVAGRAMTFSPFAVAARHAFVNGAPGLAVAPGDRLFAVLAFTVRGGRIAEIDVVTDPAALRELDFSLHEGPADK